LPISPDLLLDTSAAVALIRREQEGREAVVVAVRGAVLGLAGHAAFETYSVLTRLPGDARMTADQVTEILAHDFPATHMLGSAAARKLLRTVAGLRISGGAVFDALVAAAAVEADVPLLSRDRRASDTYSALGADVRLV